MWPRALSAVIGIWLMAAPAILSYGNPAQVVDRILGPLAASFAVVAMGEATRAVRHVNLLIGLLLLLLPWVLGYPGVAIANSMICGVLLMALSRAGGEVEERFGGGWTRVWHGYGEGE